MKFKIQYNEKRNIAKSFKKTDIDIARKFAERIYKEFGEFIKVVALFGSASKGNKKAADIDVLIILDDVRVNLNDSLIQTYRIILQKIIADTDPKRLHVQTMKFTSFWEYVRAGDPVATNILRYGLALIDTGVFDPLQALLEQGRIRPSEEAIATYFAMSPASQHRAKQHLLSAGVDLYWSVIDAAHAVLMYNGNVPPSPDHVAEIMEKTLVKDRRISKKSITTMREMYKLFKDITHRNKIEFTGKEYEIYKKKSEDFVKEMQDIVKKKK
ncbi:nucleotidyltransferase domain-containing protein [archaeon]|nr:nucleotidyltransferase domain-containing protein [archaeon]MBT4416683.1 nucleotidyltransferase domain-containing protein [archaeon]